MLRLFGAVWLAKIIQFLTRYLKLGGGSAAPGLYALKIDPQLIQKLSPQIKTNVVISGTNGKTTTARMLSHFAHTSGVKIIRNSTGSNLERGIASALISNLNPWTLKLKDTDLGIWELDEAAFNKIVLSIKPNIMVFLNLFRDQLDRYGEVDSVAKKWQETLKKVNFECMVLANGDDLNTLNLKNSFSGSFETFGIPEARIKGESDNPPTKTQSLNFKAEKLTLSQLDNITFDLNFRGIKYPVMLPLPGSYHVYDFLAAFAAGYHLNLDPEQMIDSLEGFMPAFGRVEKLVIKNKSVYLFLIKNPAGASQVFATIAAELAPEDTILLALNDNFADGRDVSWIWDADFEELTINDLRFTITCSGQRAEDLAVRLKYAGINTEQIEIEKSLDKAFTKALSKNKGRLFILPTYTAMLELQNILAKRGHKQHYWKDN